MEKILNFVKEKRKILGVIAMALVIVVISAIAFIAINCHKLKPTKGEITFYIAYSEEKNISCVYGTDGRKYKRLEVSTDDKATLHILNGCESVESIYVILTDADGDVFKEEKFSGEESHWEMDFESGSEGIYDVSFVAVTSEGMDFYVSNGAVFLDVIGDSRVENQSVNMMTDIRIWSEKVSEGNHADETILINYPFVWNTNGRTFRTTRAINFKSESQGQMYIYNGDGSVFETGRTTCDTPLWDYEIEELFGEFGEEHYYYIKANSVNGRKIDISTLYIDTEKKLKDIIEYESVEEKRGSFLLPDEVSGISIIGDYDIGVIDVDEPLIVTMDGASDVIFEGSQVTLYWNGEDAPSMDYIQRYMNIYSYNDQLRDENIGGEGSCEFLSGSLKLSSDRVNQMVKDGNYIDVYTGYADTTVLINAAFTYELSQDGKAEIKEIGGNYYCIVTDSDDRIRGYKINLIEKDYSLPVIYIETEDGVEITSKETTVPGVFTIDYNGATTAPNIVSAAMNIRGRGNSSWKLPKKPYKIKFDKKVSLFGLTEAKEWVLQANHADKSLIRNKLAMDMGNVLDNVPFTPHAYNVDVFVNGEYMGIYTIVEQIEVKDGRIAGEKDSTEVDTDYLLEIGGEEEKTSFGTNMFSSSLCYRVEVKNPDSDVLTAEQYNYISQYIDTVDDAVAKLDRYEEYLDVPSLIDWFLLNEFSYNLDGSFRRSDYLLKKKGGKVYMATYWDYDYAFGNFWRDSAAFDEWICLGNENTVEDNYIWTNWITYLLEDKNFTDQLKARWEEVGVELYDTAIATIDEAEANVSPSAEENFIRWPGVLGYKTQYEFWKTRNISTYEGQLQYLRDFIDKRYRWMDKTIKAM